MLLGVDKNRPDAINVLDVCQRHRNIITETAKVIYYSSVDRFFFRNKVRWWPTSVVNHEIAIIDQKKLYLFWVLLKVLPKIRSKPSNFLALYRTVKYRRSQCWNK